MEALLTQAGSCLPSAVAVDIGLMQDQRTAVQQWAVVEANMAWFAHSYAARPDAVLDVVLRATGPRHRFTPADQPFLRPAPPGRGSAADCSA